MGAPIFCLLFRSSLFRQRRGHVPIADSPTAGMAPAVGVVPQRRMSSVRLTDLSLAATRAGASGKIFERPETLGWLPPRPTVRPIEYYFTCTASFLDWVMEHDPSVEVLTYLDSDLFFFLSDPAPIIAAF